MSLSLSSSIGSGPRDPDKPPTPSKFTDMYQLAVSAYSCPKIIRNHFDCSQSMCASHEHVDATSLLTQVKHNYACRRRCRPSLCNTPCSRSGRLQSSLLQRMAVAPRVITVHHEHSHCGLLSCGCISGARGMGGLRIPHTLQSFSAWLIWVQRWQVHGSAVLMASLTAGAEAADAAAGSARPRFLAVPIGCVATAVNCDVQPSAAVCADACA